MSDNKTLKMEINKSDVMPYEGENMKDQKFGLYHIENPIGVDLSMQYETVYKQMVTATKYVDDKILETITNIAKENGISSVYVVDESAILETFKKAEKYDVYLRNKHISIFDKLSDTRKTIESAEQERDEALKRIEVLQKEIEELKHKCGEYRESKEYL